MPDAAAIEVKPRSPLVALTIAALALPALADTQPVETTIAGGYSNYQELDVPHYLVVGGDNRRYDIDIFQFRLVTPVGQDWSVGVGLSRETMSGASPWGTVLDSEGEPALIMSGATIDDSRTEGSLTTTHYGEDSSAAVTLTQSKEDDYVANALALSTERDFNRGLTTVSAGLSYSSDTIEPTDALLFGRVPKERRTSRSGSVGVSQVLNPLAAVYAGLSVTDHGGYLSDPYKLRDVRPRDRLEWALSIRYRRFLQGLNASLHADYRYFDDDWGIESHTLHTSWYQNVGPWLQIVPNLRYYSQAEADFFRSVDDFGLPFDTHQSSDFRLSTYGAVTVGLKAIVHLPGWSVTISADRYAARKKYSPASGAEHPARLAFTLASIFFDFKF